MGVDAYMLLDAVDIHSHCESQNKFRYFKRLDGNTLKRR